jgi:hypothetical protein
VNRETLIRRFGEAPKRCIFFRTGEPFPKVFRVLVHPNWKDSSGKELKQRIEVLAMGQQVIVDGLHPDTKRPYSYHSNHSPLNVARADLPPITRGEAQEHLSISL